MQLNHRNVRDQIYGQRKQWHREEQEEKDDFCPGTLHIKLKTQVIGMSLRRQIALVQVVRMSTSTMLDRLTVQAIVPLIALL